MSEEKLRIWAYSRRINWAVLIAIFALIITFTGINLQAITDYVAETMFPKTDFTVKSWTNPTTLPTNFQDSLLISPEYFTETSVDLKSEKPYLGKPLRFVISFNNRGKKSVEQPRVTIYFVDCMYRLWNVWNKSNANAIFENGCKIDYYFPSLDQKVVGFWTIFALLYDDSEGVLVSYDARMFTVTDIAPISWWQNWENILAVVMVASMLAYIIYKVTSESAWFEHLRKRSEPQAPIE